MSQAVTIRQLTCPQLPLSVYREVAAHLRQVKKVETRLIVRSLEPDPTEEFDYYQSQISSLELTYPQDIPDLSKARIEEILDYYARQYNPWQEKTVADGIN